VRSRPRCSRRGQRRAACGPRRRVDSHHAVEVAGVDLVEWLSGSAPPRSPIRCRAPEASRPLDYRPHRLAVAHVAAQGRRAVAPIAFTTSRRRPAPAVADRDRRPPRERGRCPWPMPRAPVTSAQVRRCHAVRPPPRSYSPRRLPGNELVSSRRRPPRPEPALARPAAPAPPGAPSPWRRPPRASSARGPSWTGGGARERGFEAVRLATGRGPGRAPARSTSTSGKEDILRSPSTRRRRSWRR
jgi:hypothetical protein